MEYSSGHFHCRDGGSTLQRSDYNSSDDGADLGWIPGGRHRVKREWSYHFYLYHMVVMNFFVHNITERVSGIAHMLVLLIMTFGITIIFAIFSGGFIDGVLSKKIQKIIFANK